MSRTISLHILSPVSGILDFETPKVSQLLWEGKIELFESARRNYIRTDKATNDITLAAF